MKVRRFFYVGTVAAVIRHRVYSRNKSVIEGDKTACGRIVSKARWFAKMGFKFRRTCKQCEKASV